MNEKSRPRLSQWVKYLAAVIAIGLIYVCAVFAEQFWVTISLVAGLLIVAGWIAQAVLPFIDIAGIFRKPPKK